MKKRITTETGSVYIITDTTWERVNKSQDSGFIRTEGGSILNGPFVEIGIGNSFCILTDSLNAGKDRLLATSPIVLIEDVE